MPIYEYRCGSCGHELEKLQRMSEDPLRDCPSCGAASLRRLISPAGFRLKGSGWYETDFKKDRKRNLVETTDKGEKKPDSKSESAKSESGKTESSKPSENKSSTSKNADAA